MANVVVGSLGKDLNAVAVIMAGGSGTRFWPMSRTNRPKQFLPLAGGDESLIQATAQRLYPLVGEEGVMVVTAGHQQGLVTEQLPDVCVLSEPCARNTAPCIGLSAVFVAETVGDVPMICLPSDHVIQGDEVMREVYQGAVDIAASEDVLVTIGIQPDQPETGYGYIKRGASRDSSRGYLVEAFVEKPSREVAEEYLRAGNYFWNSGMFVWRPSVILAALEKFQPETAAQLENIRREFAERPEAPAISEAYQAIRPISIDFGVMEQAENVVMMPGDGFVWSDVGSWTSWVETVGSQALDDSGNFSKGDVLLLDSERCAAVGERSFLALLGVSDLVVVEAGNAILVCHRERAQDVKLIVEELKSQSVSQQGAQGGTERAEPRVLTPRDELL